MRKFRGVRIRNLRGFNDLRIDGLRMFNLFVGSNGIGKTTVLEAIWALATGGRFDRLAMMLKHRKAEIKDRGEFGDNLAFFFRKAETKEAISLSGNLDADGQKMSAGVEIKSTPSDEFVSLNSDVGENGKFLSPASGRRDRFRTDWELSIGGEKPKTGFCETEFGETESKTSGNSPQIASAVVCSQLDAASAIAALQNCGKKDAAVAILRRIEPGLTDIFLGPNSSAMVRIGEMKPMPIHNMGDGFRMILSVLGTAHDEPDVMLIDEMATGVYYGALPMFLRALLAFAKENGKQVFATTHSQDLLVALKRVLNEDEGLREDAVCFSLSRNSDGEVWANPYGHEAIDHCIENGIEIR